MNLKKNFWTKKDYNIFINYLLSLKDEKYKNFHSKLVPNIDNIIGVRTPVIKKIAKEICKGNFMEFIQFNENKYYEETLLHGLIITNSKIINNEVIIILKKWLEHLDNWATCDLVCSNFKAVKNYKELMINFINNNIDNSKNIWIKRFCFVLLLNYYIEKSYLTNLFDYCEKYNTTDYYINMAVSWLISTIYIKFPNETYIFLKQSNLDKFTHNKSIQKIKESKRVSNADKNKLNLLKK